jgi:flagellar motor protein MotB
MLKRTMLLGLTVCLIGLTGCTELRDLRKQNASLKAQLNSLQADRDQLADENMALKAERDALQASLRDARAEARRMSQLVGEVRAEQDKLQQQTVELKKLLGNFSGITVEARGEGNFIVMESNVLFDPGKIELNEASTASLDEIAQYLMANPGLPIRIDGHTDGVPITHSEWKDNYHLAAMRAHAVMRYLVDHGVSEPEEPTAEMAANRRVEIMLVPAGVRSISEILEGFEE